MTAVGGLRHALPHLIPNFWTATAERPIFGKVRYMSSKNTARKMSVTGYIDEYAVAAREPRPAE